MKRRAAYLIPVFMGVLFYFYYIRTASSNVAFSDYIRLINSYLPDVGNPAKFFVPDILTRVPVTYLGRIVNVKLFQYNTFFDMGLGVLSLGAGAASLALYGLRRKEIPYVWYLLCLFVYFSLNKWEMTTNGTGWVCFLSISGFMLHYAVLDHAAATGCASKWDRALCTAFPPVLTLLVAGPYCGSYSAILILAYGTLLAADYRRDGRWNRTWLAGLAATLAALLLYLWSSSQAVYVHRGAVGGSIAQTFVSQPWFFVSFLLKALASAVVGVAQLEALGQKGGFIGSEAFVWLLGAAVAGMYLYALYLNIRHALYRKSVFPLLLILNGGLNHLLILSARWIFLNDSYGMSSRYELQYQMGILGILLTFALAAVAKQKTETSARFFRSLAVPAVCSLAILAGNVWTTAEEIRTAPFRKAYLAISRELGLNYRTASDEDLEMYLHSSADAIRSAMRILEENELNIFRK
ncbi:hypothetical protein D3Z50_13195 [Clostridiaceae bacterium]|jgi:hypothetical protein|nr:hypothetical protein [Clostridium sp.]NBI72000.1 hypothetical protein [Clostridiaceae bacterium]